MGAWEVSAFANDDAMDWIAELENDDSGQSVRLALGSTKSDYIELPECSNAVAAAEVVAAAQGKPALDLPESVRIWVAQHGTRLDLDDVAEAVAALDRVTSERSELKELWEESHADEWLSSVRNLRSRLVDASPKPPR